MKTILNTDYRIKWMMVAVLPFFICLLSFSPLKAQMGSWRAFMSYYEPQQIVKGGNMLFVRASNSLYAYNLNDQSITTYDKVNALSDTHVSMISWNSTVGRLVIVYENSNIDLIDQKGNVVNISSLYSKSMTQDKTVNSIYMYKQYAYLCTGFGIVKLNMERAEISESYIVDENITAAAIIDDNLYIRTASGAVLTGRLTSNLIDKHSWTSGTVDASVFSIDQSDWNQYRELVSTLKPDGPKNNNFGFMRFKNNMLYTAGGGGSVDKPGTVQILSNNEWVFLQDDMTGVAGTEGSGWTFVNTFEVDADPADSKRIFAAGRTGLFEFYDGSLVNYFNKDNSILNTATSSNKYVLVESCLFDKEGNLWLLQSQVSDNSLVEITKDGEWISHKQEQLMESGKSLAQLTDLFEDSRGLLWFINAHWSKPSFFCYNPKTDKLIHAVFEIANQDGTTYQSYNPHCITEDLEGNIWVGSQIGPFLIEPSQIESGISYVTQVKVPRNDGTNYADYLLSNVNISCMAVDGGNRKWIGTSGAGVYLISADNLEQIHNFTAENSPLLSNNIESIAINPITGEVFFGTDNGLCSYMSDATDASIEMSKDDVYAYPNPVVSGYDGLITVVGLSYNADVKILTTNGQLVAQGRSNGGTFTWDGRDSRGHRVASGVYMVAAATSQGKKGVVCKIAVIK